VSLLSPSSFSEVQFGREVCGDLKAGEAREWLVANGIGGFASGTVAGTSTRRYHGLLVAALQPPTGRTMLVTSLDESVSYLGAIQSLATNRWTSGFISPSGYLQIESFWLEGTKPVWRFAFADALLEKRVWMKQGENTTYVQFTNVRSSEPLQIDGKVLVGYRDFHSTTTAPPAGNSQNNDSQMKIDPVNNGLRVLASDTAVPFYLLSSDATFQPRHEWYRDFFLPAERERGLDDHEDRLFAGLFHATMDVGDSVTIVFSTEKNTSLDGTQARDQQSNHELKLFQSWQKKHQAVVATSPEDEPAWLWQLVLAADQFLVKRALPEDPGGASIIAGYPWFSDWGRDTMIALPGLTLSTGRPEIARNILQCFSRFVDAGMLPNNFPDAGGSPGYNSVDSSLWYFEALREYFAATQDVDFIRQLFPILAGIVDLHVRGTGYNIKVDPSDALLYAGAPDVQLTWMDAKVGDWVVTPRTGKAVEINALWLNALRTMMDFARLLKLPADGYARLSEKAAKNFQKFWNPDRNCCYDVIQIPSGGNDPLLRPNQIFAVSLPFSPLTSAQQKGVVDICAEQLLTSYGLRSLAPSEPGYKGQYTGGQRERDSAYHQGTVWPWLIGAFAAAHFRVYGDREEALSFLEPLGRTINFGGLGTIGEIFAGDPPFLPAGCPAQAWSVAELFRARQILSAPVK
jgi:predicted glycogen debranching enzyme